jgi:hypothetical protein
MHHVVMANSRCLDPNKDLAGLRRWFRKVNQPKHIRPTKRFKYNGFQNSFLSSDYYENHDLSPKPSKRQGARICLNVHCLPDITAWLDSDTALFELADAGLSTVIQDRDDAAARRNHASQRHHIKKPGTICIAPG